MSDEDRDLLIESDLEYWRAKKIQAEMCVYLIEIAERLSRGIDTENIEEIRETVKITNMSLEILEPALKTYEKNKGKSK
jgi:hypothetical protein